MRKGQIDRAIALLEVDSQPHVQKVAVIDAAIEVLRKLQAGKPAKKTTRTKPTPDRVEVAK